MIYDSTDRPFWELEIGGPISDRMDAHDRSVRAASAKKNKEIERMSILRLESGFIGSVGHSGGSSSKPVLAKLNRKRNNYSACWGEEALDFFVHRVELDCEC